MLEPDLQVSSRRCHGVVSGWPRQASAEARGGATARYYRRCGARRLPNELPDTLTARLAARQDEIPWSAIW